MFIDLLFAKIC